MISLMLLVLMTACAGKGGKSEPQAASDVKPDAKAASALDPPLAKPYRVIVVAEFETTAEIAKDYPDATWECQASTISALKEKKFYQAVESGKAAMARRDGTLLVKAKVTGMRIVSGHARMWGGAFTGSSFMEVDLTLIDAATRWFVKRNYPALIIPGPPPGSVGPVTKACRRIRVKCWPNTFIRLCRNSKYTGCEDSAFAKAAADRSGFRREAVAGRATDSRLHSDSGTG